MKRWRIREVESGAWDAAPNYGVAALPPVQDGFRYFHVDQNSTDVSVDYQGLSKTFETIDSETIRISAYPDQDEHSPAKYSIKLEYQGQNVHDCIKFLFSNNKEFYLYRTISEIVSGSGMLHLIIDDFKVNWVATNGERRLYHINLTCSDVDSITTQPTKLRFQETSRRKWTGAFNALLTENINGTNYSYFVTDFSPTSMGENYTKRSSEYDLINGNTAIVSQVKINPDNTVSRIDPIKGMSIKLENQMQSTYSNLLELYKKDSLFQLYGDADKNEDLGMFRIVDINVDHVSRRGSNKYYGISIQIKEARQLISTNGPAARDPDVPPPGELSIAGDPFYANEMWNYPIELSGVSGTRYSFNTKDKVEVVNAASGTIIDDRRQVTIDEVYSGTAAFTIALTPSGSAIGVQAHVIRNNNDAKMMMTNVITVPANGNAPDAPDIPMYAHKYYYNAYLPRDIIGKSDGSLYTSKSGAIEALVIDESLGATAYRAKSNGNLSGITGDYYNLAINPVNGDIYGRKNSYIYLYRNGVETSTGVSVDTLYGYDFDVSPNGSTLVLLQQDHAMLIAKVYTIGADGLLTPDGDNRYMDFSEAAYGGSGKIVSVSIDNQYAYLCTDAMIFRLNYTTQQTYCERILSNANFGTIGDISRMGNMLYIASTFRNCVYKYNTIKDTLTVFVGTENQPGSNSVSNSLSTDFLLSGPSQLFANPDKQSLFIVDNNGFYLVNQYPGTNVQLPAITLVSSDTINNTIDESQVTVVYSQDSTYVSYEYSVNSGATWTSLGTANSVVVKSSPNSIVTVQVRGVNRYQEKGPVLTTTKTLADKQSAYDIGTWRTQVRRVRVQFTLGTPGQLYTYRAILRNSSQVEIGRTDGVPTETWGVYDINSTEDLYTNQDYTVEIIEVDTSKISSHAPVGMSNSINLDAPVISYTKTYDDQKVYFNFTWDIDPTATSYEAFYSKTVYLYQGDAGYLPSSNSYSPDIGKVGTYVVTLDRTFDQPASTILFKLKAKRAATVNINDTEINSEYSNVINDNSSI